MGHTDAAMILKDAQKRAAVEAGADILNLSNENAKEGFPGL